MLTGCPTKHNIISFFADDDALTDIEDSTCFLPNEVSTELSGFKYPGGFVLNDVEDALANTCLREELNIEEHVLKVLVPLLEKLARDIERGPKYDATRVAL